MLKVKENYSSKHVDKSCRFCKTQESETQTHILEKCKEFETEAKYVHRPTPPKESNRTHNKNRGKTDTPNKKQNQ